MLDVTNVEELVLAILATLESKQDLFACLTVNRLWFRQATDVLWSEVPVRALVRVVPSVELKDPWQVSQNIIGASLSEPHIVGLPYGTQKP